MLEFLFLASFTNLLKDVKRMCVGKSKDECRKTITDLVSDKLYDLAFQPSRVPIIPSYPMKNRLPTKEEIESGSWQGIFTTTPSYLFFDEYPPGFK